ncbi:apolipoprotein N-acyltransferase [Aureimonas sp. SA4125]|uniref:apolipoprotein N-acyltransferase n=1 Tax=Aureimonas sp. SA4125 TaxID=2826993 RepID=UPI001CC5BD48|nr:apolipoprotein N-acyltransferase [Aureimonas sp. SA4125]BDA87077.1 apolipoprotein N-acyltransferase [Aureimonas sp. SA4125]
MRELAARVVLMDGWRRAVLAMLAGAITALGLAPVDFFAAGFVGFPLLVWMLDGAAGNPAAGALRRLAPAFRIGWSFGFGYFVAGLWWLGAAMLNDGNAFLWAIPLAVLVLPAILAVYYGLAAALARAFWVDGPWRILALAVSFSLVEILRGMLFTGFPWNEIGVMAAPVPLLMQSVSVVGLHGMTLAAVFVFAAPALWVAPRDRAPALVLAALLAVAHAGFGAYRLATAENPTDAGVAVRVVQPNIAQTEKWDAAEADRNFARLVQLTETRPETPLAAKTLIIWPESSVPFLLTERPDAIARLATALQPGETLIAGAARAERRDDAAPRYYNSVYVIDEEGVIVDARDKTHLVPFGEYLPFQSFLEGLGLRQLASLPGGFSAGADRSPVMLAGIPAFLPLICYEIIFQDEIDRSAAKRPGFIVNVTNDAWYGNTPGPYQHLRQSGLTAVALGLPLVRSANTGVSVVTDAYGRTIDGLALGSAGTLEVKLPVVAPFTVFSRVGNLPYWILIAMSSLLLCWLSVKNARRD